MARTALLLVLAASAFAATFSAQQGCVLPDKTISTADAAPPSACPADQGTSSVFGSGACQQCLATSCCTEGTACGAASACKSRLDCITSCSAQPYFSPSCYDTCILDNAETDALDLALFTCANDSCRDACGLGSDFRCLGQYSWPTPTSSPITLSLQVTDTTNTPLGPGISVLPCPLEVTACSPDAGGGVLTDDAGIATFPVKLQGLFGQLVPWSGYLLVAGSPVAGNIFFQSRREYRTRPTYEAPFPSTSDIAGGYGLVGSRAPQQSGTGTVVGGIHDCKAFVPIFADGVTISVEGAPGVTPAYLGNDEVPVAGLTATNQYGTFFVPNVPAGTQTFVFTRPGTGVVARVTILVAAGEVTTLGTWPSSLEDVTDAGP